MKNKKIWIIITIIIAAAIAIIALPNKQIVDDDKPVIKIGVILPLSGDSAFAGVPVRKTIQVALEDAKREGNLKFEYELIFDDNQNIPKQSITSANRLINVNRVNAILSMWSEVGVTINKMVNDKKIIHIGCSWGYETAQGKYAFNHATFQEEQTSALIKELKKRNIKSIGLVYENEKQQNETVDYIAKELTAAGVKVAFDQKILRGTLDLRSEIAKMKKSNAEIVLMLMFPPTMNAFVKQKSEMNYDVPLTSIEYFTFQPELFEGYWYISDALGTDKFGKYIKEKTSEELNSCMGNMYDSVKLLINAFENTPIENGAPIPTSDAVAETLQNMNTKKFNSVMGDIWFDDQGNIHTQTTLKIIKNGKPEIVK
jgi:branched-chain amino acid transport system substrate-binding protein